VQAVRGVNEVQTLVGKQSAVKGSRVTGDEYA